MVLIFEFLKIQVLTLYFFPFGKIKLHSKYFIN